MRKILASATTVFGCITMATAPMTVLASPKQAAKSLVIVQNAILTSVGIGKFHAHGTATLTFNSKAHVLTVHAVVDGLKPRTTHYDLLYIHGVSDRKVALNKLVANAAGNCAETTVIHDVSSIGKNPWIIVDQGPNVKNVVDASAIAQGEFK